MKRIIKTGCENYYGEVEFIQKEDNRCYICLDNYDSTQEVEIPRSIFILLAEHFEKREIK